MSLDDAGEGGSRSALGADLEAREVTCTNFCGGPPCAPEHSRRFQFPSGEGETAHGHVRRTLGPGEELLPKFLGYGWSAAPDQRHLYSTPGAIPGQRARASAEILARVSHRPTASPAPR